MDHSLWWNFSILRECVPSFLKIPDINQGKLSSWDEQGSPKQSDSILNQLKSLGSEGLDYFRIVLYDKALPAEFFYMASKASGSRPTKRQKHSVGFRVNFAVAEWNFSAYPSPTVARWSVWSATAGGQGSWGMGGGLCSRGGIRGQGQLSWDPVNYLVCLKTIIGRAQLPLENLSLQTLSIH